MMYAICDVLALLYLNLKIIFYLFTFQINRLMEERLAVNTIVNSFKL